MNPIARNLKVSIREFDQLLLEIPEEMTSKNIHRLRILTRRLRAAIWISHHLPEPHGFARLQKNLRHLGRKLGVCRELDVLLKDSQEFDFKEGSLKKRRHKARAKLQKLLLDKEVLSQIQRDLEYLLVNFQTLPVSINPLLKHKILSQKIDWPLEFPHHKETLHATRIEVKKMLYRLELLGYSYPALKALQKSLGRAHDLEILSHEIHTNSSIQSEEKKLLRSAKDVYKKVLGQDQLYKSPELL